MIGKYADTENALCFFPRFLLVVRRYYTTLPCRSTTYVRLDNPPIDHPFLDTPIYFYFFNYFNFFLTILHLLMVILVILVILVIMIIIVIMVIMVSMVIIR